MTVKNVKTGKSHDVSPAAWEKIKANGEGGKYVVTNTSASKAGEVPKELAKADYATLAKQAATAYEEKDYAKANELYQAAYAIKETKFVKEKLEELKNLLAGAEEGTQAEA